MESHSPPPESVSVVAPRTVEDRQPPVANFVNVDGAGGVFALDFFYVPESRIERIFSGRFTPEEARQEGETAVIETIPVARVMLPLPCAAELVADLLESIVEKTPEMRESIVELGERLVKLSDKVVTMADGQSEPPPESGRG
jgi:hypothetical protein